MKVEASFDLERIFSKALSTGGEFAEVFLEETSSLQIFQEDKKLDRIRSGIDKGLGLRIIYGVQSVYGYTSDLSADSIYELAKVLSKVVSGKIHAPGGVVAFTETKPSFFQEIRNRPALLDIKSKVKFTERANAVAWTACPDVTQVTVGYLESLRNIQIANSTGLIARDSKQYLSFYVQAVGNRAGNMQSAYQMEGGYVGLEFFDEKTPESIASEAGRQLDVLLSAKPAPSGSMPVILAAEAGGTMVHEAVGHGLEADLACNGLSVYKDKIGQRVASPLVSIIDDGTMPLKRGSYSFDDEGCLSKKNILIEDGVLKSYMVDQLSHRKFNIPLTGNGRRETFRHKPIVRMTNTYLASGKDNPGDILKSTPKGLFIKGIGGGQVNTVTGDFVFAVTEGYIIRNGEICEAVKGATLTGNGPQVLTTVDCVGSDLGFANGTCGKDGQRAPVTDAQPTIRIPEIVVGGEVPASNYW